MTKIKLNTKVKIINMPVCEILGKVGTVGGVAQSFPEYDHKIVQLDEPLSDGTFLVSITEYCLEEL